MGILLAGGTLIAAILGQYLFFDQQVREIISSVEIQRSLSRNPVRKGTTIQVTFSIMVRGLSKFPIEVTDQLPLNTILSGGETTLMIIPDPTPRTYQCRYQIVPLVHGTRPFRGTSVTLRNIFFEDTILLARKHDKEPALEILPTAVFAMPISELAEGSRDNRKASVFHGTDIHSVREYAAGDDLRHADWKLSAKYDKIFIRKYTAQLSHPPLIIVDLPWNGAPFPEKEFNRMIAEVLGMIRSTIEAYQHVSVLLISGPNILHLIREERNITGCIAELRDWIHPAERPVHFYNMPDRSDLRSHIRESENTLQQMTDSPEQNFHLHLRNLYLNTLQNYRTPVFSVQVSRALSQIQVTEAYFFSLGCGDSSHIRHVVRPLRSQKIRVHMRIIDSASPGTSSVQNDPADAGRSRS
jgi:uncharacterized protein (DUF58 family)